MNHSLQPRGTMITEQVEGSRLTGYVTRPTGSGPFPGVIVLHEIWGLNPGIQAAADLLADKGYAVLAPDLFGRPLPTDVETAFRYMHEADPAVIMGTLRAAYQWLAGHSDTRGRKIGALGWCFGGGWALQLGLAHPLDAVALYYGQTEGDPTVLRRLRGPVLGIFGTRDQVFPPAMVDAFETGLRAAGVSHEIHRFDAGHAFANPMSPDHQPDMAREAWGKTLAFLDIHLRQTGGSTDRRSPI